MHPKNTTPDKSEYGDDLEVSSLHRVRGEREYYKILRENRHRELIGLLKEFDCVDDGPQRLGLSFWEKFEMKRMLHSKARAASQLINNNQKFIRYSINEDKFS